MRQQIETFWDRNAAMFITPIKDDVTARGMVVGGKFIGNSRSSDVVGIKKMGKVTGVIYTTNLIIMECALIESFSYMSGLKRENAGR